MRIGSSDLNLDGGVSNADLDAPAVDAPEPLDTDPPVCRGEDIQAPACFADGFEAAPQASFSTWSGCGSPSPAATDPISPAASQATDGGREPLFGTDFSPLKQTASEVSLDVPWYSQNEAGHGYTPSWSNCFAASKAMAQDGDSGVTVLGPDYRIQVASGEDASGRIDADPDKALAGRNYLDQQLDAGRPVVVGVSCQGGASPNVDGITDHFVVVTGRTVDDEGRLAYTFNDPGTQSEELGSDRRTQNRFYVDANSQVLYRDGTQSANSYMVDRRYEVSMVRMNAAQ